MVDIENIVIDNVQDAISTVYPSLAFYSEYIETPSELPCVSLYEASNTTYQKSQDSSSQENHADVMYQLDVFSKNGKQECKNILSKIDEALQDMYFTRTSLDITPNLDRNIYRITARYEGVVSKLTNSTHYIYRR